MINIGIVIGRIGGIDGVALETEKWIEVLESIGHNIFVLAGELEAELPHVSILPELSFAHPRCMQDQSDAFFKQEVEEEEFLQRLNRDAAYIEEHIKNWLLQKKIDLLITQNNIAIPCHLTMGMALKNIIEQEGIRTIAHNHDFYWERGERYKTKYSGLARIIEDCFPANLPNIQHVVINSYNQGVLKEKLKVDACMVPNVMDFNKEFAQRDSFNSALPEELGIRADEIALFQITRIVERKSIETAIHLLSRLQDKKVKLFITGSEKDDAYEYKAMLDSLIEKLKLKEQVFFVSERFSNVQAIKEGKKIFSLADGYAHSRAITYFSTYEGFGNGFLEAIVAKKPIFVNNFKPVYWPDIGSKGFKTVQLEDTELTEEALAEMKAIIYDPEKCKEIGNFNFELGKKYFSFEVLRQKLEALVNI
ncbi:glycosyltransferase [Candidatus Riflebacteria bacterium]